MALLLIPLGPWLGVFLPFANRAGKLPAKINQVLLRGLQELGVCQISWHCPWCSSHSLGRAANAVPGLRVPQSPPGLDSAQPPEQAPGQARAEGPYPGRQCGWAQGAEPRLAPSVTAESPRQPQQALSRTCRCSSSSEWLKAGLSRELAEGSPERDQYWAETSSRRQKRR